MRVALLSFGRKGGAAQYPAQLANGLSEHVECASLIPSTHSEPQLYSDSVKVRSFDTEQFLLSEEYPRSKYPLVVREIYQQLQEIDPDIVHLPFYFQIPSILSLPLVKSIGKPVVATVHDPASHGGDEVGPFEMDIMAYLRMVPAHALDRVIVHGRHTYRQSIGLGYSEEKLYIIPHGMYDQFGRSEGINTSQHPGEILFFGHLSKYRGTDRLCDIADLIGQFIDNFQIRVAGPMSESRKRSNWGKKVLTDLRNHPRISLRDEYIPGSEVEELFANASIVLLPYYDATMSGVVMTAYSFATPIVATDTGDIGWMIKEDESGLLAAPDSTEEIARQTERLINDSQLRRQIGTNILKARERYRWENIGTETIELYREVIN